MHPLFWFLLVVDAVKDVMLIFANQVSQQIYTGNQITDDSKNPLQVQLVDTETGIICENCEGSSAKVQIVVIDGDFEEEGCDSNKFNDKIVRPRDGKAALLSGKTIITLKQGVGNLEGVSFTDNSRFIRSGKFRLGVCVDSGTSTSTDTSNGIIKEGLSEKFAVKDHRGELNKKHYPPILCLQDETWRLENIARDGKYHIRLKENGINNVQDLLIKWFANSNELQNTILRMSKNAWNKLINHAKKCPMADDSYLFRSEGTVIRFNPIGEILEAFIDGTSYPYNVLAPQLKDFVLQLASQAYKQWDKLEKVSIHSPLNQSNSNLPNERKNTGYGNAVDLERDTFGAHSSNFMNFNIDGFMDSDINSFENLYGSYSDF
ncbi:hypothetical protein LUZ60_013656 [Juncus effusus]|nr:hypothetical protein LUZ60_013656 [Juncus effusus]